MPLKMNYRDVTEILNTSNKLNQLATVRFAITVAAWVPIATVGT